MKKRIKLLIMILVGILVIIFGIVFFLGDDISAFIKELFIEEVRIEILSDEMWFKVKSSTYSLDNEFLYEMEINDTRYLSFSESKIGVCNAIYDIECQYFDYTYDSSEKKLVLESGDGTFLSPGTYDVEVYEDSFTLARRIEKLGIIAVFTYKKPAG